MKAILIPAAAVLFAATAVHAETHLLEQKDKQFSAKTLHIKAGDAVEFRNGDPFFHNIFSLSEARPFDLDTYPKGQSRQVVFDKPGKVEVECAIHPHMHMTIEVAK